MEVGGLGHPSVPVLLPVGWAFRCQSGDVTAPPPNMAVVHVWEKHVKPRSAQPNSTVQVWYLSACEGQRLRHVLLIHVQVLFFQWTACGPSGPSGVSVSTRAGETSAVGKLMAAIHECASVSIGLITGPSVKATT